MILHLQELGQPVHIDRLADIDDWRNEADKADDVETDNDEVEDIGSSDDDDSTADTDSSDDDEDSLKISVVWDDVIHDEPPGNEAT
jgi:hypothetical protein